MIRLRAHHGFCILNFIGNGYSDTFVNNMKNIIERLRQSEEVILVKGCDDICACCPRNQNGHCQSDQPDEFDLNTEKLLPSTPLLTWDQLEIQLKPHNNHSLTSICKDCEWLSLCLKVNGSQLK